MKGMKLVDNVRYKITDVNASSSPSFYLKMNYTSLSSMISVLRGLTDEKSLNFFFVLLIVSFLWLPVSD
jgi:hypothetical protein